MNCKSKNKIKYELLTIKGEVLLDYVINTPVGKVPEIPVYNDTIIPIEYYGSSALLDQLKEQLTSQSEDLALDEEVLKKVWIYVDFEGAFPLKEGLRSSFDKIFDSGFKLQFSDEKRPIWFVPLLNSSSQSRNFVYGFVRKDMYSDMHKRFDLDLDFLSQYPEPYKVDYLSKLYSYRGLYSSTATPVLRGGEEKAEELFNEESIIVLDEPVDSDSYFMYTASQKENEDANEISLTNEGAVKKKIDLSWLDGEGIISVNAHEFLQDLLPAKMRGNSYQVRMPFMKGVLHKVDFHKFLRDMGVSSETAMVKDAFGEQRDLYKAKIIITPAMFKIYGLLKRENRTGDFMRSYFEKIKKYNHGLYVVKTEALFHNREYVSLNSQLLTTLDLSAEELDELVADHIEEADGYCIKNLLDEDKRKKLYESSEKDDWKSLLLKEPAILRDPRIQEMLRNYRVSRYNDIATGRIQVRGENRFLSGDLLAFLVDILSKLPQKDEMLFSKVKERLLGRASVYIPGVDKGVKQVAMLRNPHQSRNEDVCVKVKDKGYCYYYENYLSDLQGVVFVGRQSCIPAALGGADFDGDHVILSYDKRIINACKSGYVEKSRSDNGFPFIHIPRLKGNNHIRSKHKYIVPQIVYNSFSNRIGQISNAAMKIAAVEYDTTLKVCAGTPSAALCTILTGTEIDATKKGLRPNIDDVLDYKGKEDETHETVVKEVETYIKAKKTLESWGSRLPDVIRDENGNADSLVLNGERIEIQPNREHNAVTQLLYRWVKASERIDEDESYEFPQDLKELSNIFAKDIPCSTDVWKILSAYNKATAEYSRKNKRRREMKKICEENNSKVYMRLRGQYDNIDRNANCLSYRAQMDRLQDDLLALVDDYSLEEVKELRDALFVDDSDRFNAEAFWPYRMTVNSKLLSEICDLPDANLIKEFRFEGYRLLWYLLDNAVAIKKIIPPEVSEKEDESSYSYRYLALAQKCYNECKSVALFEEDLKKMALSDLYEVLGCNKKSDVIQRIYPADKKVHQKAFWRIFSAGDMIEALGGDNYVR